MTRISTVLAIQKEMSEDLMTASKLQSLTRIHIRTVRNALEDMLVLGMVEKVDLPRTMWENSCHHSDFGWRLRTHLLGPCENNINVTEA
jgi:hypothetical protein